MKRWFAGLSLVKKVAVILVPLLLITATGASAWYYDRLTNLDKIFPSVSFPQDNQGNSDYELDFSVKNLNILFMGFDRNKARDEQADLFRPDTLMVAAIDLETGNVNIVSIPRDTLVPIYNRGGGKDKINSAYYYGWKYGAADNSPEERHRAGLEFQIETVSLALKGVPIHYYVTIDMDGVTEVVDLAGGVWYNVENPVYDKKGKLLLEAGYQLLDGKNFLKLVRNRQYKLGDIQRQKNQQKILLEAFKQFKSADKLVYIPQIYAKVKEKVKTNLSLEQIISLALFASQKVDAERIKTYVLETSFAYGRLHESWTRSYSYLIIDQQKRAELLKEVWGLDVTPDKTDELLPPLPNEPPPEDDPPSWEPSEPIPPGEQEPGEANGIEEAPGSGEQREPEKPGEPGGAGDEETPQEP